ncbi:MAG: aminotransferase class III-fold pyridoxal phosphate-dependent enzyme [Polyangiales bacterium]
MADKLLSDPSSGIDAPAAFIVETVQAGRWHQCGERRLATEADTLAKTGALLIVDDIQAGCGRTGSFFSFERARIVPDIVCLSKALSGYGLPLSLTLF